LYQEAVADGISYANSSLGYMYEKGQGVPISTDKAIEYYKKAAVDNNKYAIKALKRLGAT
jgi:TPR repeat protein